jgi:hypothetical protein
MAPGTVRGEYGFGAHGWPAVHKLAQVPAQREPLTSTSPPGARASAEGGGRIGI